MFALLRIRGSGPQSPAGEQMANSILDEPTPLTDIQKGVNRCVALQKNAKALCDRADAETAEFIWNNPSQAEAKFAAFQSAGRINRDLLVNAEAYAVQQQVLSGGKVTYDANGTATITGGTIPPSPVPAGWSITENPDGSVSVTEPA
jgi:hypothetical protein